MSTQSGERTPRLSDAIATKIEQRILEGTLKPGDRLPSERDLAVELGTRNPRVRVNCILPGPVMLPPELPEAERNAAIAATLVKREGSPQHVALAVLHFIDNDFLTGVALPVDGGRTIFAPDSND